MGVRVHLAVVVDRVSDAAWHGIYEKARRVAKHWTPRPLSIAWRQIGAVRVAQYVLDIEDADGLHLVGDAETLTTAESFVFPARLGRGGTGWGGSLATSHDDVLVALARQHAPEAAGLLRWCDLRRAAGRPRGGDRQAGLHGDQSGAGPPGRPGPPLARGSTA